MPLFASADPHPPADVQQAAGQQQGRQKQQVQPPQQQLLQQHAAVEPGKASGTARLLPDAEKQVNVVSIILQQLFTVTG